MMYRPGIFLILACSLAAGHAQNAAPTSPATAGADAAPKPTAGALNTLAVAAVHSIKYPSLNPVTAVTLIIGPPGSDYYDRFQAQVQAGGWDCASAQFYKAQVVDTSLKVQRELTISSVHLQGETPAGAPYTTCDGRGHPNRIDLVLGTQPKVGDAILITVLDVDKQTVVMTSNGKLAMTATNIPTLSATPQAAPGEALNNGATRDVGQLNVAFAATSLAPHSPVDVYVKTTDLISTDSKDSKSSVNLTVGMQRGLFPHWYSPVALEQSLQGNQTAKNLSTVTSLNFSALPPWAWASKALDNAVIKAPLPPEPTLANLYTHRFEQLVTKKTPLLAANDYTLNGSFAWDTISFPFTCKLLFWQRPATRSAVNGTGVDKPADSKVAPTTTPAALPAPATTNCLGTEIDLGGWYLPLDRTTRGTQKAEGYGDISILIPLSDFSVISNELLLVTKTDPPKFQVRIKWGDAVNQANNYARTRAWTFGIEAVK